MEVENSIEAEDQQVESTPEEPGADILEMSDEEFMKAQESQLNTISNDGGSTDEDHEPDDDSDDDAGTQDDEPDDSEDEEVEEDEVRV